MKKKLFLTLFATAISLGAYSQGTDTRSSIVDKATIGLGAGMDYGGIGGNFLFYPQKNIGLFAGLGYNFNSLGYNVGTKLRLISENRFRKASPYLMGMYGYNSVISVQNASQYDKVFYGPTVGIGMDYKSYPTKNGYWTFALLIPIRGSQVDDY